MYPRILEPKQDQHWEIKHFNLEIMKEIIALAILIREEGARF